MTAREQLRKMTKKRKKQWVRALIRLERDYQSSEQTTAYCPLCKVAGDWCYKCLWVIFTGEYCNSFDYICSNPRLKRNRLAQIKRWLRSLNLSLLKYR